MNIRLKLTLGIGLLFCSIIFLSLISISKINNLSDDSHNILRDNYNTLDYSKEMLRALEDFRSDSDAMERFNLNLEKQTHNVTEGGEKELTENLNEHVRRMKNSIADSNTVPAVRKDIYAIMELNMDAIARKSTVAEKTASNALMWLAGTGTLVFMIALVLLLNLPGNIANPVQQLTQSIEAIAAQHYSKRVHFKSGSEFGKLSNAFNTMAEKLEEYHDSKVSELLMEKKRIDTLINNMSDPVIGLDENNKVLFINNEALIISGLKKEQVLGKGVQDIAIHNDLIRNLVKDIIPEQEQSFIKSTEPLKIFAHNKESYFEKETVKITISPTGEQRKQDVGHVILLKNITSFKELDVAKTNFIATVSHELKTPLSAIKMSIQLLLKPNTGALNTEQEQLLESIEDDSKRLLKITGELLNMTQVESGKIQLNIKNTRPEEIVQYAVEAVTFAAERKHISLIKQLDNNLPGINADTDKTAWVLVNFLTNAIQYSHVESAVTITVNKVADKVKFTVTDTGKGIDELYLDKIFNRYFQVPGSAASGTGLGLAICKEFIEAQQGVIGVDSKAGVGSSFYFMI
jgi:NtrC-family two-component system sensor histidine kinase KinB